MAGKGRDFFKSMIAEANHIILRETKKFRHYS